MGKSKLNNAKVFISQDLFDSNISHDEYVLINNVPKKIDNMKKEIKNSNYKWKFKLYIKHVILLFKV